MILYPVLERVSALVIFMHGHREVPKNPPVSAHASRLLPYKQPASISPLECALTEPCVTGHSKRLTGSAKSFRMRSSTKTGGRGYRSLPLSHLSFTPKETKLLPAHFSRITPISFPFLSTSYKLPNLQPPSFHEDPTVPGVAGVASLNLTASTGSRANCQRIGVQSLFVAKGDSR